MKTFLYLVFISSLVVARESINIEETIRSNENEDTHEESAKNKHPRQNADFECEGPWRLPKNIIPTNYDITLQIDPDEPTFNGSVKIDIECVEQTNNITLHSRELNMTMESIIISQKSGLGPTVIISNITFDPTHETIVIQLESTLQVGSYVLSFTEYSGRINEEDIGLFLRSYKEKSSGNATETMRKIIGSQLEAVYARLVFPCFDEPNMKATFLVRMEHPSTYKAFSSMPIANSTQTSQGRVLDTFEKSPLLPTYTVAFLVANYSRYPGSEVDRTNILVPEKDLDKVDVAYNFAKAGLSELESYTKIPYPVSKVDHASIPDFPTEAMENWGLLVYETAFLVDDWKTQVAFKQAGFTLIAHELAHQWFGNMVTTAWWSYLWLNESFASFFQTLISDKLLPDWELWDQFIGDRFQGALIYDAKPDDPLPAMTSRRCAREDINDAFNIISYDKGACILRMIQSILGEDEFQGAIRLYLQRRIQSARPADWFKALDEVNAKLNESPLAKNLTFMEFGASWTEQAGYPVITVTRDYESSSVLVKQERFFDQRSQNVSVKKQDNRWMVPLTWTWASSRSTTKRPRDWLYDDKSVRVYVPKDDWLLFNVDASGFYRVNYDQRNWGLLIQGLQQFPNDFSVSNRMQLIDDSFALGFSHRLHLGTALSISKFLQNEMKVPVWQSGNRHFENLFNLVGSSSAVYSKLEKYLQDLMRETYRRVRLDISADEPHMIRILRENLSPLACKFGVDLCLIDAHLALTDFLADVNRNGEGSAIENLHPDIRSTVLCGGIQSDGDSLFSAVRSLAVDTSINTANRESYLDALSCTKHINLLTRHLEDIFDNKTLLSNDQAYIAVRFVIRNQRSLYTGYQFVRNNTNKITRFYNCSTNYTENLVKEISNNIRTAGFYDEIRQWIASSNGDELGNKTALLEHLESRKAEVDWSTESVQQVSDWLDTPATTLPQPIVSSQDRISAVSSLAPLVALILIIRAGS